MAIRIPIGNVGGHDISLSYKPKSSPSAVIDCFSFCHVLERVLASTTTPSEFEDSDLLWSSAEWFSNQEVVFAAEGMLDLRTINKVARTNLGVLITGETGTGKEIVARAIHEHSGRTSKPFVAFNCAAVPRELLESQLFGHGAHSRELTTSSKASLGPPTAELCCSMRSVISPLDMQPKLLRFLESGEVHPLGETRPSKVDVRLLFATNVDLRQSIKEGRFREDLFFRMNVIPIRVPALRERREEIPLLAKLFAKQSAKALSREPAKFAAETMEALVLYSWPGNVRQLANEVRRLAAMVDDGTVIRPRHLDAAITKDLARVQTLPMASRSSR